MRALVVLAILFSFDALAYPIILKFKNTRKNTLFLYSESQKETHEIKSGESLEILVLREGDWRVRYASGPSGCVIWNFDDPLGLVIEACESWFRTPGILLVCDLEFTKIDNYVLRTNEVIGEIAAIDAAKATIVFGVFFDQFLGLVTEDHRPEMRRTGEGQKTLLKEIFDAITATTIRVTQPLPRTNLDLQGLLSPTQQESPLEETEASLVENSIILTKMARLAGYQVAIRETALATPSPPVNPGILAHLAGYLPSFIK